MNNYIEHEARIMKQFIKFGYVRSAAEFVEEYAAAYRLAYKMYGKPTVYSVLDCQRQLVFRSL